MMQRIPEAEWRPVARGIAVTDMTATVPAWREQARRFVCLRQTLIERPAASGRRLIECSGYTYRVFVTSVPYAAEVVTRMYTGRADSENRIKELKEDLQRQLGIGGYQHAWHLRHRLRKGMVNDNRTTLSGLVEVDEPHIGGPVQGKKGRGVAAGAQKSLGAGTVEVLVYTDVQGKCRERAGRLRLEPIADASGVALGAFLTQHVAGGSKVRTDGWRGYSASAREAYPHHIRVVGDPRQAARRFPHIHRVFSNLKAWLNGTHHGVEPKHLPSSWDEFVFRFNRRKTPMAIFQTLLGISAQKSPISLTELLSPESK